MRFYEGRNWDFRCWEKRKKEKYIYIKKISFKLLNNCSIKKFDGEKSFRERES
jgi:hypothetical protein